MEPLGYLEPTGGGDPIPLLKSRLLIGRRGGCDIALKFPNVSSRHCELEIRNGYWHVTDLGSRNGIKVNGLRCDAKYLLPGDELTVAKHRYEVQYTADPTSPPPEEEDIFAKSLMEKAGLERSPDRPRRRRESSDDDIAELSELEDPTVADVTPTNLKPPKPTGNSEDDDALRWLSD